MGEIPSHRRTEEQFSGYLATIANGRIREGEVCELRFSWMREPGAKTYIIRFCQPELAAEPPAPDAEAGRIELGCLFGGLGGVFREWIYTATLSASQERACLANPSAS